MMIHYFIQEEENVADEEEEPLTILAVLPQFQAAELSNVVPTHGGSSFGRSKASERLRMGGHAMLCADHFVDNASCTGKVFGAALG
jgi:hypothetical protein